MIHADNLTDLYVLILQNNARWCCFLALACVGAYLLWKQRGSGLRVLLIPAIDMFSLSGLNAITQPIWLADFTHPNALGYSTFWVPLLARTLPQFAQQ